MVTHTLCCTCGTWTLTSGTFVPFCSFTALP